MARYKIGILTEGFLLWGGGIDFLRIVLNAVLDESKYELFVFIPQKNIVAKINQQIRKIIKTTVINLLFKLGISKNDKRNVISTINKATIDEFLCDIKNCKAKIVKYGSRKSLNAKVKKNQIHLVFPAIDSLGKQFPCHWVGYIYDFQHKYYPDFFTKEVIDSRDKSFSKILNESCAVIVNSIQVKKDILKYYDFKGQIIALPFSPILNYRWLDIMKEKDVCSSEYGNYFIISNQFWKHKDHMTAFKAIKVLVNEGIPVKLICTGNRTDFRFPKYAQELDLYINQNNLQEHIIFLGLIPKNEQIRLLINSIALIQPTLFEGGPGGGAVYNALSLGISVILSDIDVNKEINNDNIMFFKAGDEIDLAEKMKARYSMRKEFKTRDVLLNRSEEVVRELKKYVFKEFSELLKESHMRC